MYDIIFLSVGLTLTSFIAGLLTGLYIDYKHQPYHGIQSDTQAFKVALQKAIDIKMSTPEQVRTGPVHRPTYEDLQERGKSQQQKDADIAMGETLDQILKEDK